MRKHFLCLLLFGILLFATQEVLAAPRIDIYGPGQMQMSLVLAKPLTGPSIEASNMGHTLHGYIYENLSVMPFLRVNPNGGLLAGVEPPDADLASLNGDLVVTALWPSGDSGSGPVQMRVFDAGSERILGKEYGANSGNLRAVADKFCADLLEVLIGSGTFFRSTLCYVQSNGKFNSSLCLAKPTGREHRAVATPGGKIMSPCWSQDCRHIIFSLLDRKSHSLGVWNGAGCKQVRFHNSVVIGPTFLPGNKVAVGLSHGNYPAIFQLNRALKKERMIEGGNYINVSPSASANGSRIAFTSSRQGGPQIFVRDGGGARRVSLAGGYNSEPNLSPDGSTLVYSRLTSYGHRIFVHDMNTGQETQVSFGPGSDEQPSICADNYFIAFSRSGQGIFLTTRHGGEAKCIVRGSATFPRWNNPTK